MNYYSIFRQKTGMAGSSSLMTETEIDTYLDQATFLVSCRYATPWLDFNTVDNKYKYGVTLLAAIEYWWTKVSEYASKFDTSFSPSSTVMGQKSETMFTKALTMIKVLGNEISELDIVVSGSGDILVGDLVRRSKRTGYLVPRSDDIRGDWLS
jgi:hypothetical protein